MAFRAASLSRSLTAQIGRTHRYLPLRTFSRSSIRYDSPVSDVVQAGDLPPATPPEKRGRGRPRKNPLSDDSPVAVKKTTRQAKSPTTDDPSVTVGEVQKKTKRVKVPTADDLIKEMEKQVNKLAEKQLPPELRAPVTRGRKKIEKIESIGGVELPPTAEWLGHFPSSYAQRARASIMNEERAKELAEAFVPLGSEDKIIIEAFPGPGLLTRALLDLPKTRIKKLIILEDDEPFLNYLRPLEQVDPRVIVVPLSGFLWDTYEEITNQGLLRDVKEVDWSQEHPHLQFISHVPARVHGEQLVSQFFRSIPDQQWLFRFGRVPLSFIMSETLWERVSAPLGGTNRCKLSVIAESTSHFDYAIDPSNLKPYKENFHPRNMTVPPEFIAINVMPLREQWIEKGRLDAWDYCLRRLFVQKTQPLKKCIPQLAPGAMSILTKIADTDLPLEERVARRQAPRKMCPREWRTLVNAFIEWPFKPADLSVDNFFTSDFKEEGRT